MDDEVHEEARREIALILDRLPILEGIYVLIGMAALGIGAYAKNEDGLLTILPAVNKTMRLIACDVFTHRQ